MLRQIIACARLWLNMARENSRNADGGPIWTTASDASGKKGGNGANGRGAPPGNGVTSPPWGRRAGGDVIAPPAAAGARRSASPPGDRMSSSVISVGGTVSTSGSSDSPAPASAMSRMDSGVSDILAVATPPDARRWRWFWNHTLTVFCDSPVSSAMSPWCARDGMRSIAYSLSKTRRWASEILLRTSLRRSMPDDKRESPCRHPAIVRLMREDSLLMDLKELVRICKQ